MLSPLRNRFGIPGVISVIALVFAMLGGAYAANNSGGGKATASAKGKPGPRGKTGKTGPAGPAGPQGPAGAKGDTGAAGANGKDGSNGSNGAPGASVANTKVNVGDGTKCSGFGGAEFKVGAGTPTLACNGEPGEEGPEGPEGSPWTAGGTLPPGRTLTGAWAFSAPPDETEIRVPISFEIRLASEPFEEEVHFQGDSEFSVACPGTTNLPTAEPGQVCVYRGFGESLVNSSLLAILKPQEPIAEPPAGTRLAGRTGAVLYFANEAEEGELAQGSGVWAVTARCGPPPCP